MGIIFGIYVYFGRNFPKRVHRVFPGFSHEIAL
jgi:hypothetical protein